MRTKDNILNIKLYTIKAVPLLIQISGVYPRKIVYTAYLDYNKEHFQ